MEEGMLKIYELGTFGSRPGAHPKDTGSLSEGGWAGRDTCPVTAEHDTEPGTSRLSTEV